MAMRRTDRVYVSHTCRTSRGVTVSTRLHASQAKPATTRSHGAGAGARALDECIPVCLEYWNTILLRRLAVNLLSLKFSPRETLDRRQVDS